MSEATDLQIVREMFDSWNTQDLARYRKALDAECTVATHHVSDQVRGCQAACDAMRGWFDVFPDLHFHIEDMIPIGKRVLTRWLTTATPQSEGMRSPSAEPQLKIHGCSVIELRNGKVVQMWSYWDSDEMVRTVSRPRRGNDHHRRDDGYEPEWRASSERREGDAELRYC